MIAARSKNRQELGASSVRAIVIIGLIVLGVVALYFLSGILEPGGDVEFSHYWTTGTDKEAVENLIGGFESAYPELSVHQVVWADYSTGLRTHIDEGVVNVAASWFNKDYRVYASQGKLTNLDEFWEEKNLDNIFPEKIANLVEVNGVKYGVPLDIHWEGGVVFYNLHVFNNLGLEIPQTWSEFEQTLHTIKDAGVTPFAVGFKDDWPRDMLLLATLSAVAGPDFYLGLAQGENSWTDQPVQEAFEIIRGWCENGYFESGADEWTWTESLQHFSSDETAMYLIPDYASSRLKKIGWEPGVDYYIDFIPRKPGVEMMAIPDIEGLVIPSAATNKEHARTFLEYCTTAEAQRNFAALKGATSPSVQVPIQSYGDNLQISMWETAENLEWVPPLMWFMTLEVRETYGQAILDIYETPGEVNIQQICAGLEAAASG